MFRATTARHHRTVRLLVTHRGQFELLNILLLLLQFESRVAGADASLLALIIRLVICDVGICTDAGRLFVEARHRFIQLVFVVGVGRVTT